MIVFRPGSPRSEGIIRVYTRLEAGFLVVLFLSLRKKGVTLKALNDLAISATVLYNFRGRINQAKYINDAIDLFLEEVNKVESV